MMMQTPSDMAPTTMANAVLWSSMISFHSWYGVSLSMRRKQAQKIRTPKNENTTAFTTKLTLIIPLTMVSFESLSPPSSCSHTVHKDEKDGLIFP